MAENRKKHTRDSAKSLSQIKWARSINLGLSFSVSPKRFLPFLFSDITAILVIAMMMLNDSALVDALYSGAALPVESLSSVGWGILAFGAWMIVNIWITGAVIHQTRNPAEFRESWRVACRRLPALLMVLIAVSAVSFAVSSIPVVGTLLSFIVAMAFLFVNHFIILDGKGFSGSLRGSSLTFRNRIIPVFVAWMLSVIFVTIIIGVFTIPLIAALFSYGSEYWTEDMATAAIMSPDMPGLFVSGFVLMIGIAISRVFSLKYLTEIYLQFKKKKWLSF